MIMQTTGNEATLTAFNLIDVQIATESYFSRTTIKQELRDYMYSNEAMVKNIDVVVKDIEEWIRDFDKYDSKIKRLAHLQANIDIKELIEEAMLVVLRLDTSETLLATVAGQLATKLDFFENKKDAVVTAGEIFAIMDRNELIYMENKDGTYFDEIDQRSYAIVSKVIVNPWALPTKLRLHIERSMYPLPMLSRPKVLTKNTDSGYLTVNKASVVLGGAINHHEGTLSLDVLNTMNTNTYSIDTEMVHHLTHELNPIGDLTDEQQLQYDKYMVDKADVVSFMVAQGNKFHLTHAFDKRGRTYSRGYHVNTQGNSMDKAIIELSNKVIVEPDFL